MKQKPKGIEKTGHKNELSNNLLENWSKKFRSFIIYLTAGLVLTSSSSFVKAEFTTQEFQDILRKELESLNTKNPEKLAIIEISKYAGQFVELSLGKVLENSQLVEQRSLQSSQNEKVEDLKNRENNSKNTEFSLQNLGFQGLGGTEEHIIGFVAQPKIVKTGDQINNNKDLQKLSQIGKTIAQNVGGETAKSDYAKYKLKLVEFLSSVEKEKPENLLLSAFAIQMVNGKSDSKLIEEFTKRGYSLVFTAMAASEIEKEVNNEGENQQQNQFTFGNAMAIRGKIDPNSIIKIRVPPEGLSLPSDKNLNSQTLAKILEQNSALVYTNPVIETTTIDQNGNKITHIIGLSYFSYFSNKLMREANFEQIADYCRTFVLKDPSTQILITGDFNTMGDIDGRDLGGNSEVEEMVNQARNFLPNLGSSFDEIRNFKLILDRINFELYQQTLPENRQNKMKKLKYKESDLPFRGFGIKENILKMLNLILDGTIIFTGDFEPNLYIIEYKYFGSFDHAQTMVKPISLEEFEIKQKQKAHQLATNIAITQIMNRRI